MTDEEMEHEAYCLDLRPNPEPTLVDLVKELVRRELARSSPPQGNGEGGSSG